MDADMLKAASNGAQQDSDDENGVDSDEVRT